MAPVGNSGGEGAMSTSNPSAAGTAGGSAFMFDKGDELLVEADEIPALVRSAFESDNSAGGLDGGGAQPARATDQLLASLRHIVAVKENEVAEITKCHYEDFVRSVDELRMVKRYSTELRRQVQNFNSTLSASGETLYNTMEHAASLHRASARIEDEINVLGAAVKVAQTLLKLQQQLNEKQFYAALRTLRALRQLAGSSTSRRSARALRVGRLRSFSDDNSMTPHTGGSGGGSSGGSSDELPDAVRAWAQGLISPAEIEIDRAAMQSFKDWLVIAREEQESVGRNAIMLGLYYGNDSNLDINEDGTTKEEDSNGSETRRSDAIDFMQQTSSPLKHQLDLTPVYRCAHIYNALHRMDTLNTIYERERALQLKMCFDFPSNHSFQTGYEKYLSNIIGFFVVEDRVLRTAPGVSRSVHVEVAWEDAATAMRGTLISQIQNITSLQALQALSSYINLTVSAVERFRLSIGVFMEALAAIDKQIRQVLLSIAVQKVEVAIEIDMFTPLDIHSPDQYHALVTEAELDVDGKIPCPAKFPAVLPFSSCVPVVVLVIKQAAQDCKKYLNVLDNNVFSDILINDGNGSEGQGTSSRQRKDALSVMSEVIVRCCVEPLRERLSGGDLSFSQVINLCCNVTVLELAFGSTFDAVDVGHLTRLKEDAEQTVVEMAKAKLMPFMNECVHYEWSPDTVSDDPPNFMLDIIQFLSTIVAACTTPMTIDLSTMLYRSSIAYVCEVVIDVFSNNDMNFTNEGGERMQVKRWNMFGMMMLDTGCRLLEEWYYNAIMSSPSNVGSSTMKVVLPTPLLSLRQIINFFLSKEHEAILERIGEQHRDYNHIPTAKLCQMIDKYRDVSTMAIFQNYHGAKSFPKRRNLDQIARKLKAMAVQQ